MRQQFWLGTQRAGQPIMLWIDTTTVHLAVDGVHLKTLPSRMTTTHLARLRAEGARPAGPCSPQGLPTVFGRPRSRRALSAQSGVSGG